MCYKDGNCKCVYCQEDYFKEATEMVDKIKSEPEFKRGQKYFVLKIDDINKYLKKKEQEQLHSLAKIIQLCRLDDGKKSNTYVVVNESETYAEQVWELIKSHVTGAK